MTVGRAAVLLLVASGGCARLPDLQAGTCGNHVVEASEDCDGFAPSSTSTSMCIRPGAVGECHLDCGRRSDGSRPSCPAGWGCAPQGICRPPTGEFDPSGEFRVGGAWSLMSGDFDGDGRGEIVSLERPNTVGGTKLRFHYFDEDGVLVETRAFPKTVASPVVTPHPGSNRSDLVFIDTRLSVSVLLGQADRNLVPEAFSSYHFPGAAVRLLAVGSSPIDDSSAIVILTTIGGVPGFYVPDSRGVLRHAGALPGPIEALAGEPADGNIIEDARTSPCRELVLAIRGATSFSVVDPCTRDGTIVVWRDQVVETTVALVPPAEIDAAPILADLNGDGHLDVLIGADGKTYAATGDGRGLGTAVPFQLQFDVPDEPPHDTPMPLAAGDFTGDGVVDFVFGDGLLLSMPGAAGAPPRYLPGAHNQGAPWTVAWIADLNDNGKVDVVAASSGRLGIDFFNGEGTQDLPAFSIPTDGPVEFLVVTDLDGDLINDLALIEPAASEGEPDSLKIAFGNSAGPPSPPTPIARIPHVDELSVLFEAGVGNLTVASTETVAGRTGGALAVLSASGDRLPIAPYQLVDISTAGVITRALAGAVAVGGLTGPGHADVMALASAGNPEANDFQYWLLPPLATSEGPVLSIAGQVDSRLTPVYPVGSDVGVSLVAAAADLDGDLRDETLWVMPADAKTHCALAIVGLGGAGPGEAIPRQTLVLDEPCLGPQVVPVDADADGWVDIALLTGAPGEADRKLLVLWNDGTGGFARSAVTTLSAANESPQQFAVLPPTPLRPSTFAYVTDRAAIALTASGAGSRQFGPPRALADVQRGTGIVAADVNGDGIPDLALAASGNLRLLKARLAPP